MARLLLLFGCICGAVTVTGQTFTVAEADEAILYRTVYLQSPS